MRLIGVIQARTGSKRLPGKSLTDIAGLSAVEWLHRRASSVPALDQVVVAVPEGDTALLEWASGLGVTLVEGPEDDVLARFCEVTRRFAADAVVRMTADCPLLDPALVADLAARYASNARYDYCFVEGYPRGCGDAEVISTEALHRANREATSNSDREHVVTYVTNRPAEFAVLIEEAPEHRNRPELRLCIDEPADLTVVSAVVGALGIDARAPGVDAVIHYLDAHPDLVALNAHVQQRS